MTSPPSLPGLCFLLPSFSGVARESRVAAQPPCPFPVTPIALPLREIRNSASPRLRGTLVIPLTLYDCTRFIPALAGNTGLSYRDNPRVPVHPRACGEHHPDRAEETAVIGSSPRLRGTQLLGTCGGHIGRFIPAACGEHRIITLSIYLSAGSSPRLRGTRRRFFLRWVTVRFIPALAGNTKNAE